MRAASDGAAQAAGWASWSRAPRTTGNHAAANDTHTNGLSAGAVAGIGTGSSNEDCTRQGDGPGYTAALYSVSKLSFIT